MNPALSHTNLREIEPKLRFAQFHASRGNIASGTPKLNGRATLPPTLRSIDATDSRTL